MAQFETISRMTLESESALLAYLIDSTFSQGKKGGTFVGTFKIAPEAFRRYGIVLPKGGMILPDITPEDLFKVITPFRESREEVRMRESKERKAIFEQHKLEAMERRSAWAYKVELDVLPALGKIFKDVLGEAQEPVLEIQCTEESTGLICTTPEGGQDTILYFPDLSLALCQKQFRARCLRFKYRKEISALKERVRDLHLILSPGREDYPSPWEIRPGLDCLEFSYKKFALSTEGLVALEAEVEEAGRRSNARKEEIHALVKAGCRIESSRFRYRDEKALWNFGDRYVTSYNFGDKTCHEGELWFIRKECDEADSIIKEARQKETVEKLSIRIFIVRFDSRTSSETVFDEVGLARQLLQRAIGVANNLSSPGRFFKASVFVAEEKKPNIGLGFHSSLYGENKRYIDGYEVAQFLQGFDLRRLV